MRNATRAADTAAAPDGEAHALPDDGTGGVARYRQLASVLRHRIVSGEWPLGHQLPTVERLAQTYGIARVTVRQAFAVLAEEGLVSSQRGRGTHVTGQPCGPSEGMRSAINNELVGGSELEIRILDKRRDVSLPPGLPTRGEPLGRYVLLRKLHMHDGEPFCLIELYVAESVFSQFPRGSEKHRKIARLLREAVGERLGIMHQTMTVEPADYAMARALAYGFAAPIAKIVRTTLDIDGKVLTAGCFWYRGDRFILDVELPAHLADRYPALAVPDSRS
ncbi:GntR family transcriptional regulator [Cupriavidus basilensis]|uniref:GntR family transcriptional regulator n=1 Tax=Cupriavidus basilensis TaxID=68895 RepID=UPI0028444517|nr:GntR family transcriptional regulator [Cupriavidus basilensis]MDR3384135.1 GntR family transcriptional regulator [Cupriavidus basilensis]